MRILLAEDEKPLARALVRILEKNNFSAEAVYTGEDALHYLESGGYDVAILDITMPKMDGIAVVKRLRAMGSEIPVIMLSAKSEIDDKVLGLDSGANDYITKPFDAKELVARIRAVSRGRQSRSSIMSFGNITLDRAAYMLSSPTGNFRLANKEYQIIEMLLYDPGRMISTEKFMEKIWGCESDTEISVVWVYISYLRKKLQALDADIQIRSVRNVGYTLEKLP